MTPTPELERRAALCVTHFAGCDCQEWAQRKQGRAEGLREAAAFAKSWCRCLEDYKARGVQDPCCVACELAAELAGKADEVETT